MKNVFTIMFFATYLLIKTTSVFALYPPQAIVELNAIGQSTLSGDILFSEQQEDGTVTLQATITGLPPLSKHAIHIHEKGNCEENGTAAGGHWNPLSHQHAHLHETSRSHKGDIGNLQSNEQGEAILMMSTNEWCISCDDVTKNILGKSIIIHEGKDDFTTQPTGGAGGRIGCGIIKLSIIESEK